MERATTEIAWEDGGEREEERGEGRKEEGRGKKREGRGRKGEGRRRKGEGRGRKEEGRGGKKRGLLEIAELLRGVLSSLVRGTVVDLLYRVLN